MIRHDVTWLSPEWWSLRRGIPTASDMDRIITPVEGKPSKSQMGYIHDLVADVLCQHPGAQTERVMNAAMRHGTECEPEARNYYAMQTDYNVILGGFCVSDDGRFGASPDGLIVDYETRGGCLELKCPQASTHVKYLLDGGLPADYKPQVHGHLIVTGLPWVDFLSYVPGGKPRPLLVRVERDEYTDKLAKCLEGFWSLYLETLSAVVGEPVASAADVQSLIRRAA